MPWFDESKVAAALGTQAPGADGRNILTGNALLSTAMPIAAPKWVPPATRKTMENGELVIHNDPGYFISSNGTILNSSDGGKTFSDRYDNPTGNGEKDKAVITYQVTDDGKTAVPIAASNKYDPSAWVDAGRDLAKWAAIMATAGTAGAYLQAGGLGAGGGAGAGAGAEAGAGAGGSGWFGAGSSPLSEIGGVGGTFDAGATYGGTGLSAAELGSPSVGSGLGSIGGIGGEAGAAGAGGAGAGAGGITAEQAAYGALENSVYGGGAGAGGSATGFTGGGTGGFSLSNLGTSAGNYLSSPQGVQSLVGLAGSYLSSQQQAKAAEQAVNASNAQYQQTRSDNAPWRAAGASALGTIGDLMGTSGNKGAANYGSLTHQFNAGDLKTNLAPNYQWQLEQGLGATANAANASGFSGNALRGINDYAQNYAGNAYQQAYNNYNNNQTNIYNRLSNLAGLGQTANQIISTSGTANTANANNYLTSGAAAQAAGIVGGANAINNGISNYQGWNYLNQKPGP